MSTIENIYTAFADCIVPLLLQILSNRENTIIKLIQQSYGLLCLLLVIVCFITFINIRCKVGSAFFGFIDLAHSYLQFLYSSMVSTLPISPGSTLTTSRTELRLGRIRA